ncbi:MULTISPECIES: conjugative transposon protein TraN [unclassified Kaistella]|uniref:conjugative transposon protein TraN n=1 Tax=unclassified Kaistella TaxID=2762626 RepID=UPI0027338B8C|nr:MULTISPECIES: conjugative transposon protein TraN [unclassified Kaistella]MDP2455222.1 conjugative transposon protein TraN [Kaistella sp. SH11-4b]MDP2458069.1 conjugative transposon protein TraN [Kaistella sp. SH40-3]MDP2461036.1 conjugative transposon protein TraN [Kaistella sp. SH19-2b]
MIKNLINNMICGIFLFSSASTFAQTETPEKRVTDLTNLEISKGISLHIISPESIQFVDLSTNNLTGDLPADNIARIKITELSDSDSIASKKIIDLNDLGVITIVCQSFMAQYKINYLDFERKAVTNIQIQPEDMQPLEYPKLAFSTTELQKFSLDILRKKMVGKPIREVKNLKLKMQINNVYVVNDYIFLDMTFLNSTNLGYDIDAIKFSVEDKKIYKATNNQSIALEPVYQLYRQKEFKKNYRNIYVFKKFTYPNSKVMKIRLLEEQLSGRAIEMKVKYSDILDADTF